VEIASGVVHTMTLDELDAAYQRGLIDDATRVRQSGAPKWSTLAAVAGADDAGAAREHSETPGPVSAEHHSLSPMQVTVPPPPAVPRELAHLADLADDDELRLRGKRRPVAVAGGILGVAAVAGLVAFGATRAMAAADVAKVNAASAMRTAPLDVRLREAGKPLPAEDTATDRRNLSDGQRRALVEADKKRSAEAEKKRAKSAPHAGAPRAGKVNDGLLKGGDKYDPLNGTL
jgi:hypothetical protein